jgi:hypothetical protein
MISMLANLSQPLLGNRLSYRPATIADLERCFQVCGAAFAYTEPIRSQVPQVWQHLLQQNVLITTVIEANAYPHGRQIVGLGAAAFVTDAFMERAKASQRPYIRELFVRLILEGNSPVLSSAEAQAEHRGKGLNLFFFNDTLATPNLSEVSLRSIYEKWSEALYDLQACHIKEILWEFYGDNKRSWPNQCGLCLRQDWTEFWQQHPQLAPPIDQRPYLVGLTREESEQSYGTHSSYLFLHTPARCWFTELQQELLQRALEGETDDELAKSLNLSLSTIKKRWQGIYNQVWLMAPDIFSHLSCEAEKDGDPTLSLPRRGSEKRRHLLNYIRQHREEIHPINAVKASEVGKQLCSKGVA